MTSHKNKVLLIEPDYPCKFPPLGLMKLATYHRMQGWEVVFYKGKLDDLMLSDIVDDAITKLNQIDSSVCWQEHSPLIYDYLKRGVKQDEKNIADLSKISGLVAIALKHFRNYYKNGLYFKNPRLDRVCVSTLFTFHWKITVDTINFAKRIVKDTEQVLVGGVMASLAPDELAKDTGVKPHVGLLNVKSIAGDRNLKQNIDDLPLDYSILDETDYQYADAGAYYGYTTRGCVNKCTFCAVPKIEPVFQHYVPITEKIRHAEETYGEQKDLILLDNNVLASDNFNEIIDEIKECGYVKGAKYVQPNQLNLCVKKLKESANDRAYLRKAVRVLNELIPRLSGKKRRVYCKLLRQYRLTDHRTATKNAVYAVYEQIAELYEKRRRNYVQGRYVDFNQGLDVSLITEDKMQKLSEIPFTTLRFGFNRWEDRDNYSKAVRIAQKYGAMEIMAYLIYNHHDKPVELYRRMRFVVELSKELCICLCSFPMKYQPIYEQESIKSRNYIGKHWNKKYLKAVQTILSATRGTAGRGKSFFEWTFGKNESEFLEILSLPDAFVAYRSRHEKNGQTGKWWKAYRSLDKNEKEIADSVIATNDFTGIDKYRKQYPKIYKALSFHRISRSDAEKTKKAELAESIRNSE